MSIQRPLENPLYDPAGVEELLGQRARRAAMPFIIRFDRVQCRSGFVHGSEPEQSFRLGQEAARSRVLHDRRLAAREIADRSITGPAVDELRTVGLDAAELPFRTLQISPVLVGRRAHVPRFANAPPLRLEARAPFPVMRTQTDRQLQVRVRPRREAPGEYRRSSSTPAPVPDRCRRKSSGGTGGRHAPAMSARY